MFNPSIIEFYKKKPFDLQRRQNGNKVVVAKIGISTLKGLHIENI